MTYSVEINETPPKDWNNFLKKCSTGNIQHTVEYSKYAEKRIGWKPLFFRLISKTGKIVLQCLIFEEKNDISGLFNRKTKLKSLFKSAWKWNYGPVSDSIDAINFFYTFIKKSKKHIHVVTHPLSPYNKFHFKTKSWATYIIDLHKTKEELFLNLNKKSARKNIKKSIDNEVIIEQINEKSLKEYHELLTYMRKESGTIEYSYEFTHDFWKFLQPVGFTGFLAKKNDIPLGGLTFGHFNGYVIEMGVARSKKDKDENLFSQDLIKWKIIEWGVDNKMNYYDLAGHNPNPTSSKEAGIKQFKKKWGGDEYNFSILDS
jgi:hypothetical protein